MVDLPSGMGVRWLEVSSPANHLSCTCNHPMASCDRFTCGDYFDDTQEDIHPGGHTPRRTYTQEDISVEICLDLLLPVDWYRYWGVVCCGFGCMVNHQLHGCAFHHE